MAADLLQMNYYAPITLTETVRLTGSREGSEHASTAVLAGIVILTIFAMSHAIVEIPHNNWIESVLVWVSTSMPMRSGNTSLYKYLSKLLEKAWNSCMADKGPLWLLEEAAFKKMLALLS